MQLQLRHCQCFPDFNKFHISDLWYYKLLLYLFNAAPTHNTSHSAGCRYRLPSTPAHAHTLCTLFTKCCELPHLTRGCRSRCACSLRSLTCKPANSSIDVPTPAQYGHNSRKQQDMPLQGICTVLAACNSNCCERQCIVKKLVPWSRSANSGTYAAAQYITPICHRPEASHMHSPSRTAASRKCLDNQQYCLLLCQLYQHT
jgi:hypothetical protein